MKNYILLSFAVFVLLFSSCSKNANTDSPGQNKILPSFSNLVQPEDGTPYTVSDASIHQQWTGLYRADAVPGTTKMLQIFQDSAYVRNLNGHVYWDSLKGTSDIFPSNTRILTISTTGLMGVSNKTSMAPDFSAPSAGNTVSSGTAFQPNSTAASFVLVNSSLSGIVGVNGTVSVATSATSTGTYTTVVSDAIVIAVLGAGNKSTATVPVPKGYWVKVTLAGATAPTATYTKWSLQ